MGLFSRKTKPEPQQKHWKITKECLQLIIESAKSSYPQEFGGMLRRDDITKDTISEVVLLPGTISGDSHAIFRMHMKPIDFSIVGTVHSHPSPSARPSQADIQLFERYGSLHIIMAYPFTSSSWQGYNHQGNPITIAVV
jgi:proteasome lid subunit RPN8/RPN11